jgi:hypothetical protein
MDRDEINASFGNKGNRDGDTLEIRDRDETDALFGN